jgi:hypothetical protein
MGQGKPRVSRGGPGAKKGRGARIVMLALGVCAAIATAIALSTGPRTGRRESRPNAKETTDAGASLDLGHRPSTAGADGAERTP